MREIVEDALQKDLRLTVLRLEYLVFPVTSNKSTMGLISDTGVFDNYDKAGDALHCSFFNKRRRKQNGRRWILMTLSFKGFYGFQFF